MNFFNDDPFEDIVKEFFSPRQRGNTEEVIKGEEEERTIDFIEVVMFYYK